MKKPPNIKLVPIDLSLAKEHECPGLNTRDNYLILYDRDYYAGKFSREWYGLNFDGVYDAGVQFDAPGFNSSRWQAVWKIEKDNGRKS